VRSGSSSRNSETDRRPATIDAQLILASGSPQRRAILEQLGVAFTVIVSDAEELESGEPEQVALENARRKATAVSDRLRTTSEEAVILGVDTLVELDGEIYGKPPDCERARATLGALAGRTHRVVSGVCVLDGEDARDGTAVTTVTFRPLTPTAIEWYLGTGEWRGRAGGYAIQERGATLVSSISGDYLNVVGLPVAKLLELIPSLLFPAVF
jgi:septum formation protein